MVAPDLLEWRHIHRFRAGGRWRLDRFGGGGGTAAGSGPRAAACTTSSARFSTGRGRTTAAKAGYLFNSFRIRPFWRLVRRPSTQGTIHWVRAPQMAKSHCSSLIMRHGIRRLPPESLSANRRRWGNPLTAENLPSPDANTTVGRARRMRSRTAGGIVPLGARCRSPRPLFGQLTSFSCSHPRRALVDLVCGLRDWADSGIRRDLASEGDSHFVLFNQTLM